MQAFTAFFDKITGFPVEVKENAAAKVKTAVIDVAKEAKDNVAFAEASETLALRFDKNTPDGVYTYRVTEVPKTGDTYQKNTQVFIVKVKVDQSQEGNDRAKVLEMKAGDGALSAKVDKLVFVNHRIPQPITVSVVKKWVNNNPAVTQPKSVVVQLYVNGAPKGEPVTLTANAENNDLNWKYTWPEGTVYDTEVWTVVEKAVPKYETTYSTRGNTITVTNTSKGIVSPPGGGDDEERGDLQISKITRGDTTFAAEKEFKMKVTLDGNGIPKGTPYKLNGEAVTGGVKTAGIIPMHAGDVVVIEDVLDGTKYTVEEESGNGYFATYTDATGTIAAGKTVKVEVKNHSNNFGVVLNLLKQVVGLEQDGKNYTFDFDLKLIRVDGVPVTDGAADKTSITVKAPEKEVATEGEEVSTRATDEVVQGSGTFELSFNKDTANGVYVYQVTERSTDATVFKANKQVFEVAVKVDQTAEQRAQIISVTNENGKELSKTAPLTFVNTTLTAAPKKLVTVQKAWASVEGVKHPVSVEVQLDVTLDGQTETYKAVLNADNNWTTAWTIDKEATWTVKETKVDGFATADGGTTWTADNTKEYYTAKIAFVQNGDDTVATITNTRNVPGGGGGGNGGGKPPVNIEDNDVPKTDKPDLEEVLGDEDVVAKEEDGIILGAEDEKVEAAETGDNKAIFFAGAGMMAALAGIFALRKKKED
ncbi:MAG: Cna B-type domain-containing protein [Anaerotignum sp.]|nr:Cna B-type domain-containing protein [Anaerotignum sp.]